MGEERIVDVEVKREPWLCTRVRDSRSHKDIHKENTSPKPLFGKMRGAEFEFCSQWGSKPGVLDSFAWLGQNPKGFTLLLEGRQPGGRWYDLRTT